MHCFSLSLTALSLLIALHSGAQSIDASHYVPQEKNLSDQWKKSLWSNERKPYKGDELTTIGMPCGGIAAGQLYVTGDGTLANWWIANNAYNTGYGIDHLINFETPSGPWKVCYQTFEPFKYIEQGFSLSVKQNGKETKRLLNKNDFDDISFTGEYPVARINYASKANPVPLEIVSTVYSPFIPLNSKESATPATILQFSLKNTSTGEMAVSLTGFLQNMVCIDLKNEARGRSRNRVMNGNGMTTLFLDLVKDESFKPTARKSSPIEDFESGTFKFWKVDGDAFGTAPVKGSENKTDQSMVSGYDGDYLVNSYASSGGDEKTGKLTSKPFRITDDFIVFRIGGGASKDKTCMNLLIKGKIVRSATGENSETLKPETWDVKEFRGQEATIEIVDDEKGGWGHINVDAIALSNVPAKEAYFPGSHPYFGNVSLSYLGEGKGDAKYTASNNNTAEAAAEAMLGEKLTGSVGTSISLRPGESRELTFVLSWFFPNRPLNYGDGGNWTKPIPTDGPAVGNMYANWYGSSLEVAQWIKDNHGRLRDATMTFHDTYYNNSSLPYWLIQRLMMPVSTLATETCQWWANDRFWAWEGVGSCVGTCTHVWNYEQALAHLFPDLERNIRERTDYGTSFREDGGVLARNGWGGILIDGHAGAILKAYREHLRSKDNLFLARNWDRIKKATQFIIKEDGNEDGLIEKEQANTYDIAFYGANTYVGSLYLASLKAASIMASMMSDSAFAKKCNAIFESGRKLSVDKLWNGEYFIQDVDLEKHKRFQYGRGCLSDQLFGQTWAHLYGLGYIYPESNVKKALQSVWKYNWNTEVGAQTKKHAPERTYADFDEPGLLIATWPFSKHMGEDGVRYRDEVWTGIEYQVATNMIYEGMIEEGLSLVKAVHERYNPSKHNPWNEIECGDHYARALASWGVLVALQGFQYNGPEKEMTINPVSKGKFAGFFTGAEGWGNYSRTEQGTTVTDTINVKYGRLALKRLNLAAPGKAAKVEVSCAGRAVPVKYSARENLLTADIDEVTVTPGAPLIVKITRN